MTERWRVTVDRSACLGSAICAATAPHAFRLEDGRSQAIEETIDADTVVLDAAEMCPAEAIAVRDGTGRQLAP